MNQYHQLTLEEREKFWTWKREGISLREIGRRLGRSHTTLTREKKRNAPYGQEYIPCRAEKRARKRMVKQREKAPLKGPLPFLYVREHLKSPYRWSPETIAGRLFIDCPGYAITPETIYSYIYGRKQKRMRLWRYLRLHRKKRMKKEGRKVKNPIRIIGAIQIQHRPKSLAKRNTLGHWETDNMEGKRSDRSGVSVSVDRASRQVRLRKLDDHMAMTKARAVTSQFKQDDLKSVTIDRGSENACLPIRLPVPVYACTAYHSWEKGTVENTVGRVRWFIPKGMSVDGITPLHLFVIERIMNTTPRKVLGFLTPDEYAEKIRQRSSRP